jgi:hypothetical protein
MIDPAGPTALRSASMPTRNKALGIVVPTVLSLLALTTTALATDVRGTMTIPPTLPSIVPATPDDALGRVRYWDEWNGFMDPRSPHFDAARELAVVLTGASGPSTGEQPPYRIHNGSLFPATIVARAGTGIQIRNDDANAYELFAEGLADFAPLPTAAGNPRPITLPAEPGNWPIHDRLYAHVHGHLHSIPDLVARAFVEPSGAYVFRGVAPGSYILHVYHGPREAIAAQPVEVLEGHELVIPALLVTPPS